MLKFVIAIGVILVIAILLTIFRIQTLVSVAKSSEKKTKAPTGNNTNALLFLLFLVVSFIAMFWYSIKEFDNYQLPIASEHGVVTDQLFWITMAITGVVFLITHILLFWFSYKYKFQESKRAYFFPHNDRLEVIWTIVPALVLTVLVISGWQAWSDITSKAPDDAEEVEIMGYQFAWRVRYPGMDANLGNYDFRLIDAENEFGMDFSDKASFDDFTPRDMVLPKGKPVLLRIRARDVLHSVFAPHFRLKMDAVPGMPTQFWFVPTKTTEEMRAETGNPDFTYEIACTEICGRGHFSMRLQVVVLEPEEYEKWKSEQQPWLANKPDYLAKVPDHLKELATITSGLNQVEE
ncbi:cytochrome c oxidase subunit II [Peijinzhouia sedimentorum]